MFASRLAPAVATPEARDIAASYDAAQTTRHNENHWANADALSPKAANTTGIRRVLRSTDETIGEVEGRLPIGIDQLIDR